MITTTVTRTVARGIFANRSKVLPPVRSKLLLTLRPYAYGEDVILDDIYGNIGEDVVVEWRERYGEDVPIVAYMIPESMQAEMFAILGEGLWFDSAGTAKQVNCIELAQSPEINQWAVWYRLDAAAGLGNREVLFYNPDTLLYSEYIKISNYFKNTSGLYDAILYYDAEEDPDTELTGGPSTFNSSILGPQYRRNADGTYTAVPAGGPVVDTFDDGFVGLRSCGAVQNLLPGDTSIARSVTLTAQSYTLQVFGAGSASCSYGTATVGSPLTFTATAGTTTFTPSGATTWMLRALPYPLSIYVPPGVTQPASNATTTGGNWFANPDGSPLWKALDGEPNGVELVVNGGFDSDTAWSKDAGVTISGGVAIFTNVGSGFGVYKPSDKPIISAGARYVVTYTIISITSGSIKAFCGSTALGVSRTSPGVYTDILTASGVLFFQIGASVSGTNAVVDNISVQRIQPQPLTLATRIKMGVGSGDLPTVDRQFAILSEKADVNNTVQRYSVTATPSVRAVSARDGSTTISAPAISATWPRNAVIKRFVQVNDAGTHFRAGYMIEGTHTTIQWSHTGDSSTWAVFDGSFNPSTLYRLMIGYNNAHPMWLNKLAVWKRQVSDAELVEVFS